MTIKRFQETSKVAKVICRCLAISGVILVMMRVGTAFAQGRPDPLSTPEARELLQKAVNAMALKRQAEESGSLGVQLMAAIRAKNVPIASALITRGANPNTVDQVGHTVLAQASGFGLEGIVAMLLQKGAQVNQQSRFGMTPLMIAAAHGQPRIIAILLQKGADTKLVDVFGLSFADYNASISKPQMRKLMLSVYDQLQKVRRPRSAKVGRRLIELENELRVANRIAGLSSQQEADTDVVQSATAQAVLGGLHSNVQEGGGKDNPVMDFPSRYSLSDEQLLQAEYKMMELEGIARFAAQTALKALQLAGPRRPQLERAFDRMFLKAGWQFNELVPPRTQ